MTRITTRVAIIIALAIALVVVATFGYNRWQRERAAAAQSKVDRGQADAVSKAAGEAVETIGNNADKAAATDKMVREGSDAITNAPAGNSNDAALRASCRMRAYRDTDRCRKLLQPPGAVDMGDRRPPG